MARLYTLRFASQTWCVGAGFINTVQEKTPTLTKPALAEG